MTQAIILAAGRGSRMLTLTEDKPKCLVKLGGRTLFSWQLDALTAAGARPVSVVTGYRGEQLLTPGLGNYEVIENSRWAESNMVRSLVCAAPILRKAPAIVSYSDIVYKHEHVQAAMDTAGDIVITADRQWLTLWNQRFADPLTDAETFRCENKRLLEIGRRAAGLHEIEAQYMGLLKFTPVGWARVEEFLAEVGEEEVDRLDMTALLSRLLVKGTQIRVAFVDGGWAECDSGEDLASYERLLAQAHKTGCPWSHDWRPAGKRA